MAAASTSALLRRRVCGSSEWLPVTVMDIARPMIAMTIISSMRVKPSGLGIGDVSLVAVDVRVIGFAALDAVRAKGNDVVLAAALLDVLHAVAPGVVELVLAVDIGLAQVLLAGLEQ